MILDIVSDLHIDFWEKNNWCNYNYSNKKNIPFYFKYEENKSNILIISGDICDDLDLFIKKINNYSIYYDKILFIDGNHEHTNKFPYLYSINEINDKIIKYNNPKLIYLPKNEYIINDTVFIGYCGWWNYSQNMDNNYFKNYLPKLTEEDCKIFNNNVLIESKKQYNLLIEKLNKYSLNKTINNIIIITHTVAREKYVTCINTEFNSLFNNITKKKYPKLKKWIFGHTHDKYDELYEELEMICHPRGRPDDYNSENYNIKKFKI